MRTTEVASSHCRFAAFILLGMLCFSVLAAAQETEPPSGAEFVIGVEDRLKVSVWKEPELTLTVIVRPDGKITFPLVGDLVARGRTPSQLDDELTQVLGRFIKDPVVTVSVEEINSFKVFVLGEVKTQGQLVLRRRTRLLQGIALAGGLTAYADKSNVVLVREEDGRESRMRVDYRKVISGERPELNVYLKPGDTIIVN